MQAVDYDDRGGFGFVYFDDNARVGWTSDHGIFPGNWAPVTELHLELARQFLEGEGKL